jgi:phenylalanyl-tRNA synthetase beta chain
VLVDLFEALGYDELDFKKTNHPHFDVAFELINHKRSLGLFGLITKKLNDVYNIDEEVYLAELNLDDILKYSFPKSLIFKDIPKFPVMRRDFSLLLDKEVSFEAIKNMSHKTERKILKTVELFDVFEGKKLPNGKKSYGISFTFQDQKKTLTDKQVDKVMEKLKQNFSSEYKAELRQ